MQSPDDSHRKDNQNNDSDHNKLNFIRFYGLPSQSQFKCHFVLRKIHMPRKQSIDEYFNELRKKIGQFGSVAILQLSNVYKNQLVDVDVGMMYDKDAISIINSNTMIKLQLKDGNQVLCKPYVTTIFKMYLDRQSRQSKPIDKVLPNEIYKKQSEKNETQQQIFKPKQTPHKETQVIIRFIGVPKQYDKQDLIEALRRHPEAEIIVRQNDIKENEQVGMFCYLIWLRQRDADILLNYGFEIRGIPILVLQKNDVGLKPQLAQHQIRIMSLKQKSSPKYIYNMCRKYGVIVNLFDFNSAGNNFLVTFAKKKSVQAILNRQFDGLKLVEVDKNEVFRLQRISTKSIFYSYLRSEQ